jgi:hypothetical protein
MPLSDLVPCFYTGQRVEFERPAETRMRGELRVFKARKLGKFTSSGRVFLFFKRRQVTGEQFIDGPVGVGNLAPFSRPQNPLMQPEKLHYPVPHANDLGQRRHSRKRIRVSARNIFANRSAASFKASNQQTNLHV